MPEGTPQPEKKGSAVAKFMPVIIGVVAIGYAIAAYFLLLSPKLATVADGGQYDTGPLEARVEEDRQYLSQLRTAGAEFVKVNPEHKRRVAGIVPLEPDVPGIFVEMDGIAQANGMVLVSIDTVVDEKAVSPLGMKTVRIAINLAGGTYRQMTRFLRDVERVLRITDIRNVTFTPGSGNYGMVLTSYFLDRAIVFGEAVAPPEEAL